MIDRAIPISFRHRVYFTRGVLDPANPLLAELLTEDGMQGKVLFAVDEGLGIPVVTNAITNYFQKHPEAGTLAAPPILVPGGEQAKNDWHQVERLWQAISDHTLCRHSYVIALGGGALLDLAGFASATAHRGIRHLRLPTTTLSQGDGGVGVKNGVNYFGKKNWIGTFAVPHAVINDFGFLETLPARDKRAGLIEAVKVSLIRDRAFYEAIESRVEGLANLESSAVEWAVEQSARHHVDHIATQGDPFELGSARPLDFGHWVAHKLETLSHFILSHGEAVAIGMAVDLLYSVEVGLLEHGVAERILKLIEGLGFAIDHPALHGQDASGEWVILKGLDEFREHLGGALTITLIPEIGRKIEVHQMDRGKILQALCRLKERQRIVKERSVRA